MAAPAIPGADQEDPSEYHEIVMDIRPFMRFLASHSVESTTAAIVLPEECAVFLVHVGDRSQGTVMAVRCTLFLPFVPLSCIQVQDTDSWHAMFPMQFFIPAAYDF